MSSKNKTLDIMYDQLLLISKHMLNSIENESTKLGYNRTEYLIILDILDHPHTTAQEISTRTGIKKSALSRALNPLITKGIILKSHCQQDQREINLSIDDAETKTKFCKARLLENMFSACPSSEQSLIDLNHHLNLLIEMMEPEKK